MWNNGNDDQGTQIRRWLDKRDINGLVYIKQGIRTPIFDFENPKGILAKDMAHFHRLLILMQFDPRFKDYVCIHLPFTGQDIIKMEHLD